MASSRSSKPLSYGRTLIENFTVLRGRTHRPGDGRSLRSGGDSSSRPIPARPGSASCAVPHNSPVAQSGCCSTTPSSRNAASHVALGSA
jgi:hypothetical protein